MVLWYRVFRNAAYINALISVIWTVLLIIPSPPFSYLLVIVERGGPGTWFLVAYFLYLIAGSVGFAGISSMLYIMEVLEKRSMNRIAMYIGFSFSYIGVLLSSVMLGVAGEIGGYEMYLADYPETRVASLLSSFVYPITFTAFLAVIGIIVIIIALMSSRAQSG
jgi:heme/copper-type cytochrome/quinol oxidase subunit 1